MCRHDQCDQACADRGTWFRHRGARGTDEADATPSPRDPGLSTVDSLGFLVERLGCVVDGASEVDVAEQTGVDVQTLRRFLSGRTEPTLGFILSLLREYDLSAEWLLFGNGPERLSDVAAETIDSAPSEELLRALRQRLDDLS